jgi:hypothetical protein
MQRCEAEDSCLTENIIELEVMFDSMAQSSDSRGNNARRNNSVRSYSQKKKRIRPAQRGLENSGLNYMTAFQAKDNDYAIVSCSRMGQMCKASLLVHRKQFK